MASQGPVTAHEVVDVLEYLGGEADSSKIKKEIVSRRGDVLPEGYDNWNSYRNTIDQVIQYHCPDCRKFLGKDVYFAQVARGRYRLARPNTPSSRPAIPPSPVQGTSLPEKDPPGPDPYDLEVVPIPEEDDEIAFSEGKETYRLHRTRERNPRVVNLVKRKRLTEDGLLKCEICGFSFAETYGDLGEGFIEAHHTIPLSRVSEEVVTKETDIVLVCSNCHRMLHRIRPWPSVEELANILVPSDEDDSL